jgi:hypothetical protein
MHLSGRHQIQGDKHTTWRQLYGVLYCADIHPARTPCSQRGCWQHYLGADACRRCRGRKSGGGGGRSLSLSFSHSHSQHILTLATYAASHAYFCHALHLNALPFIRKKSLPALMCMAPPGERRGIAPMSQHIVGGGGVQKTHFGPGPI